VRDNQAGDGGTGGDGGDGGDGDGNNGGGRGGDGTLDSDGYNLVEKPANCTLQGDGGTSLFNQDPQLGQLAANGGPTFTHLPQLGSPVVDAGAVNCTDSHTAALVDDQRGRTRPVDGDADTMAYCDIGAVEVQGYLSLAVTIAGEGEGIVTSSPPGITCGGGATDCTETLEPETAVTLTATAVTGWMFEAWSGGCSGSEPVCTLTLSSSEVVTATFGLPVSRVFLPVVIREW